MKNTKQDITQNIILVIFGATGDHARTHLIPALYNLFINKKLDNFSIIGAAYDDISQEEFKNIIKQNIFTQVSNSSEKLCNKFINYLSYTKLNFTDSQDYKKLSQHIEKIKDTKFKDIKTNLLLYCSSSSKFFIDITKFSIQNNIIQKQDNNLNSNIGNNWQRIVYEKPFGLDLDSAIKINNYITKALNENQIFRVDHFLAKSLVENMVTLRKDNPAIEYLWNNNIIDYIYLKLNESISIGTRGKFYESVGVLLDVVQNHLLQMLALTAIKLPSKINYKTLQKAKAQILSKTTFVDGILGQYKTYRQTPGVAPDSTVPTYAALKLKINTKNWRNIPFYIESGKCLSKTDVSITIQFKPSQNSNHAKYTNALIIDISPEGKILFRVNIKTNLESDTIEQNNLTFCYMCIYPFGYQTYEPLFEAIFANDHIVSVSIEEIESAWRIIQEIEKANLQLFFYNKKSDGPEGSKAILPQ